MCEQRLEYAWRTDKGKVRRYNEDAVAVDPDAGLVIVADGIGGAIAGDVASRLATRVIGEWFANRPALPADRQQALELARDAVAEANRIIWDTSQSSYRYAGMGTTVVVGFAGTDWLAFAHVGDSRLYRLRDGALVQLTRDHSLIQEVVDQGFFPSLADALRYGIQANILTRGLGSAGPVAVDSGEVDLRPGDIYLFCTDGLTGMVPDGGLRRVLLTQDRDLDDLAADLVDLAWEGGGLDNITVALLRVNSPPGP